MGASSQTTSTVARWGTTGSQSAVQRLAAIWALAARTTSALRRKTAALIEVVQSARMMATLGRMTDAQLRHIGISRSDLPNYAESLMKTNGKDRVATRNDTVD